MATTDKSIKQLNSNAQSAPSTTSKTQELDENSSELPSWLVPGKLYYAYFAPSWSTETYLVLVQFVNILELKPGQKRDADVGNWVCRCYVAEEPGSINPITFVKIKDLRDKDFIDGELYKCLT